MSEQRNEPGAAPNLGETRQMPRPDFTKPADESDQHVGAAASSSAPPPPPPPPPPGYGQQGGGQGYAAPQAGSSSGAYGQSGHGQESYGQGGYGQAAPPASYAPPPSGGLPQGYGQPPPSGAAGYGLHGKRRNIFAVWIGLPLITFGIYSYVWIYKTNKELAQYDQRIEVNPALSVLAFIPGAILIVPPFVALWRLGNRVAQAQRAADVQECSPVLAFILMFISSLGILYLQAEINKIWDRYPGATQGQPVPLAR